MLVVYYGFNFLVPDISVVSTGRSELYLFFPLRDTFLNRAICCSGFQWDADVIAPPL